MRNRIGHQDPILIERKLLNPWYDMHMHFTHSGNCFSLPQRSYRRVGLSFLFFTKPYKTETSQKSKAIRTFIYNFGSPVLVVIFIVKTYFLVTWSERHTVREPYTRSTFLFFLVDWGQSLAALRRVRVRHLDGDNLCQWKRSLDPTETHWYQQLCQGKKWSRVRKWVWLPRANVDRWWVKTLRFKQECQGHLTEVKEKTITGEIGTKKTEIKTFIMHRLMFTLGFTLSGHVTFEPHCRVYQNVTSEFNCLYSLGQSGTHFAQQSSS